MTQLTDLTPSDRVLVVAPHPDDESIATGGLLQAARAAGAIRRVLLVTDGDNNPWPQRWSEKRWHIGPVERARWGLRRRTEAISALTVLGVDPEHVRYLGLPDLGITAALMSGVPNVAEQLRTEIDQFQPTLIVLPELEDRHPDHSALHVAVKLALEQRRPAVRLLAFAVHGPTPREGDVALVLTDVQRETKRAAIQMHATQMQLSRKRFVAYAKQRERFRAVLEHAGADPQHPLRAERIGGDLCVRVDHNRWRGALRGLSLFVVAFNAAGTVVRFRITPLAGTDASIRDMVTGTDTGRARVRRTSAESVITLVGQGGLQRGWIKLGAAEPGLFVFDKIGWQTISPSS